MKPMLKKDFFSAIENLLKAGFQPRFYTVNSGRIGLITFTDKNGTKQVEQVYSCTSLAANTFGKRFTTWLEEIFQKHNEKKVADSGIEVGSRVWDKMMYTVRTISEIRAGGVLVLVLDNGAQRTLDEVQKTAPEANQVEPKEISSLKELLNASKNLEPTSPELIAALNEAQSTAIKR